MAFFRFGKTSSESAGNQAGNQADDTSRGAGFATARFNWEYTFLNCPKIPVRKLPVKILVEFFQI